MGDMQQAFIDRGVRNFYSVSISGYHIAEAGANPISQLAFTLANGFTYVEAYLARGMDVDDFAPNLSFFFSNGMDAEYTVHRPRRAAHLGGRDAERYGASRARAEAQVPHPDESGRSLHAQEIQFNDIRTTLQALLRDLRQLQLAAHQRLRRGHHDADRGERPARDGDPAHHQPRAGPGPEREPDPGRLHHRRADRPGRGGRAGRSSSASPTAAACSARWSRCTSAARSRRSRCSTSTASTRASCRSSASTRSCADGDAAAPGGAS